MTDFTTYTDAALYAELAGRESMRGLSGMAAKLNDREIFKICLELESRSLPTEQPGGPRRGPFYGSPPETPRSTWGCCTPTPTAVSLMNMLPKPSARLR